MPLWNIYCPEGAYSPEDKRAFAERITDLYAEFGLPRFFVSVVFQELPKDSYFVGGEPTDDFIRIWIDQIARRMPDEARGWWMKRIRETVGPFATERDLRWEVHIDDTPREMWSINGLKPPAEGSDEEQRWVRENRPSAPVSRAGA
jgi:phenylpyruvate tautomerase PptA (4-oxalocrotonate tautomerase family)